MPTIDRSLSACRYYPSGTDYTMQSGDTWFYEPTVPLRTLDELIYSYHQTVGHNTNMELDFAIDRDGLLREDHAVFYKRFGDWIRSCYGSPLAQGGTVVILNDEVEGTGTNGGIGAVASVSLLLDGAAQVFDRVVLTEDQTKGQIVRGWLVEWSADNGKTWTKFGNGSSIGNKRIVLAKGAMSHAATDVRLNITASYGGTPSAVLKVGSSSQSSP